MLSMPQTNPIIDPITYYRRDDRVRRKKSLAISSLQNNNSPSTLLNTEPRTRELSQQRENGSRTIGPESCGVDARNDPESDVATSLNAVWRN